jgi:hypothetical protein
MQQPGDHHERHHEDAHSQMSPPVQQGRNRTLPSRCKFAGTPRHSRFLTRSLRRDSPGGGDVKGVPPRFRSRPYIGRSDYQVVRTVRCAVTDYAFGLRRDAGRGGGAARCERCAGKWRIEDAEGVPRRRGHHSPGGACWAMASVDAPRGHNLSMGPALRVERPYRGRMLSLETAARRRARARSRQSFISRGRGHCDGGLRAACLLGS